MSPESRIVEEVRERAMKISAKFGHDLHRYAQHLKEVEKQHSEQVVDQITVVKTPEPKNRRDNTAQ